MKRLVPISVVLLTVLLVTVVPLTAAAQTEPPTIYVVQPGDTAVVIAGRYCMTVQEFSTLNGEAVNQLSAGMQIRVVNRCGGGSGGGNPGAGNPGSGYPGGGAWNCGGWSVFDRGPRVHAMGWVYGSTYVVALGDTSFSIGQRFGISADALGRANGINPWRIWAGQRLIIPGLGGNPCPQPCPYYGGYYQGFCPPGPYPIPVPITPQPTTQPPPTTQPVQPRIQVTSPAPNATLPPTFTVTGTGQGLFEGSLVVRAVNSAGAVLAQQPVTLQGTNVGAGGAGTFSVQLTVNVPQLTSGSIVALAPQTPNAPPVTVPVTFSPGSSGVVIYKEYQVNQCQVTTVVGRPYYVAVGGQSTGTFGGVATYSPYVGAKLNNQLWFLFGPIGTGAVVWAPSTSISNPSPGCQW